MLREEILELQGRLEMGDGELLALARRCAGARVRGLRDMLQVELLELRDELHMIERAEVRTRWAKVEADELVAV